MNLYLMQHGDAVSKEENPQRPLSQEGRAKALSIARYLNAAGVRPVFIWHSGKERSRQTATIMAQLLPSVQIEGRNDLNPLDPVSHFPDELKSNNKDVLIVGHLPFLQKLASLLVIGNEEGECIAFCYCAVACFEYQNRWRLLWYITPEMGTLLSL